jgi:hypothetical protein
MRDASAGQIIYYDNPDPDAGIYNYMLNMDSGRFWFNFSTTNTAYDIGTAKASIDYNGIYYGNGLNTLVNLYGASAQAINVGQTAYYDPASQVSSIALNINCGDNQYYEVMVLNKGPYTSTNLDLSWLPNNTTYSGQFQCAGLLSGTSGTIGSTYNGSMANFYFDDIGGGVAPPYLHKLYVYTGNSSAYGMIMNVSAGGSGGINCGENFTSSVWNSTSTRWTSLGTINCTTTSYLILVTRLY